MTQALVTNLVTDTREKYVAAMEEAGRQRASHNIRRAIERDDAGATPAGVAVIRRAVEPLSVAIADFVSNVGKPGRRAVAQPLLEGVDPEMLAYLTVKVGLGRAIAQKTLFHTASVLGQTIDDELRAARFEDQHPALYNAILNAARSRGTSDSRLAGHLLKAERSFEIDTQGWTREQREMVGLKLIDLLVDSLDIIEIERVPAPRNRSAYRLIVTPTVLDWFHKFNEASTTLNPIFMPIPYQPVPWTAPVGGGYGIVEHRPAQLVSRARRAHRETLGTADMSLVYEGLNNIQNTAWQVNRRIYDLVVKAAELNLPLPGVPSSEAAPLPEMPDHIAELATNHPDRAAWRRHRRDVHMSNVAIRSDRLTLMRRLNVAKTVVNEPVIYFPHHLDFRGRAYPICEVLSPQGNDMAKALLHFHDAVPLGKTGVGWLAVHGANLWGNDKVPFAERRLWAWDQHANVLDVAADPLGNLWWTEADKPWQFLAWCFEWAAMLTSANEPEDFPSRLAVALDGSCNGLQHFAAMLRDEATAVSVNLIRSDAPRDIYQDVANLVIRKLQNHEDDDTRWMAEGWLAFGIDRKITKRAVMVLPYGGTYRSCLEYVGAAVRERIDAGEAHNFGDELNTAINMLTSVVWAAMGEAITSAREVMTWVQQIASLAGRNGLHLSWIAPTGFPVLQSYTEQRSRRVQTRFMGTSIFLRCNRDLDTVDARRSALAASPNFVHTHDAAAMLLTVIEAHDRGLTSFAVIHDSYGTHAANTDILASALRDVFVKMYEDHDPLADLYNRALELLPEDVRDNVPPPPAKGDLDIRAVLDSPYFFA